MSTRGFYTIIDEWNQLNIYIHSDNYPSGAAQHLQDALPFAWELPRFEADEFAAALCAGAKARALASRKEYEEICKREGRKCYGDKTGGGQARVQASGPWTDAAPIDLEYRYEVSAERSSLYVRCFKVEARAPRKNGKPDYDAAPLWHEALIYDGPFKAFVRRSRNLDKALPELKRVQPYQHKKRRVPA